MSSSLLMAAIAVVAVAVLGLLMRRVRSATTGMTAPPVVEDEPVEALEEEGADGPEDGADRAEDEDDSGEVIAVTSDGLAFVSFGEEEAIRLSPTPRDPWATGLEGQMSGETLRRGDLIGARVKRGAPDHDPWRLEALGRDRELHAWRFETEEAARTALELVERCIVRPPRDEYGEETPVGDEAYDEARRLQEEIERELALMTDAGEDPEDPARRPIE
jgi:hypothetical protein